MELTLKDYFLNCVKKWWLILTCIVVLALGGGIYGAVGIKNQYTSSTNFTVTYVDVDANGEEILNYTVPSRIMDSLVRAMSQDMYYRQIIQYLEESGYPAEITLRDLSKYYTCSNGGIASSTTIYCSVKTSNAQQSLAIASAIQHTAQDYLRAVFDDQKIILRIINMPEIDLSPERDSYLKLAVIFGAIGLVIGFAAVLILTLTEVRVKDEDDLTKRYGVPVLGVIPQIRNNGKIFKKRLDNRKTSVIRKEGLADESATSDVKDAFGDLAASVLYAFPAKTSAITVVVTSSRIQEGKSTVASNLASYLARAGKKTLLVDCDLRKPRLHRFFGKKAVPGMSNYLCGAQALSDIVTDTNAQELDLICAGTVSPNPTALLKSKELATGLEELSAQYDYLVIDTPPIAVAEDALILGRYADALIYVVAERQTKYADVKDSLEKIDKAGLSLLGTVLNNSLEMSAEDAVGESGDGSGAKTNA